MAITLADFNKIWASTSPLTPYSFSESNYKQGWNFIGSTPPARQMWDFLQKQNDEKMQYLANNYLPLTGGTITGFLTGTQFITSKARFVLNHDLDKGTVPTERKDRSLYFCDKNGGTLANCFGMVESAIDTENTSLVYLRAIKNESENMTSAYMGVGVRNDNSVYSFAPTPPNGDNSNQIATTEWVNTEISSLFTTVDLTISGSISANSWGDLTGTITFPTGYTKVVGVLKIMVSSPSNMKLTGWELRSNNTVLCARYHSAVALENATASVTLMVAK